LRTCDSSLYAALLNLNLATAMAEKRRILFFELAGIVFIIIFGSILHFTFEWSGNQAVVGVFSAVNESVWEHLKLGFWPAIVFALIEFKYLDNDLKKAPSNFLFAKTIGIYLIPIIIMAIFYSYTAVIGESILFIDILSFVIAVIVGQLVSYRLLTGKTLPYNLDLVSLAALVLLGLAFAIFTFYPPQLPMFQDPITGEYGLISR
jgi:hypothetical protein